MYNGVRMSRDDKLKHPETGGEMYVREFPSLGQLIKLGKTADGSGSSHKLDKPEWSGTETYQDAIDLVEGGWPEGRQKLKKMTGDFSKIFGKLAPENNYIHLL